MRLRLRLWKVAALMTLGIHVYLGESILMLAVRDVRDVRDARVWYACGTEGRGKGSEALGLALGSWVLSLGRTKPGLKHLPQWLNGSRERGAPRERQLEPTGLPHNSCLSRLYTTPHYHSALSPNSARRRVVFLRSSVQCPSTAHAPTWEHG